MGGFNDPVRELAISFPSRGSREERIIALKCVFAHSDSTPQAAEIAEMLGLEDIWLEAKQRGSARKSAS